MVSVFNGFTTEIFLGLPLIFSARFATLVKGAEFVSCIELIEHINPEDHPGLVKTIFGSIQPKMAVITTPNGEFNDYWATMPHGKYRHPDHRFEWTRNEFKTFVESVLELYPEYSVTYDGIVRVSIKPSYICLIGSSGHPR